MEETLVKTIKTQAKLKELQDAYQLATTACKKTMVFDGVEYVTSYIKYVIEYLINKRLPK